VLLCVDIGGIFTVNDLESINLRRTLGRLCIEACSFLQQCHTQATWMIGYLLFLSCYCADDTVFVTLLDDDSQKEQDEYEIERSTATTTTTTSRDNSCQEPLGHSTMAWDSYILLAASTSLS
jgi:hypothetical protein